MYISRNQSCFNLFEIDIKTRYHLNILSKIQSYNQFSGQSRVRITQTDEEYRVSDVLSIYYKPLNSL